MTRAAVQTERINFRANPEHKRGAEQVLHAMGLNLSDGLNMFLARVAAERRVPFALAMTREETLKTETVQLGEAAVRAIQQEVERNIADRAPIGCYDPDTGRAYVLYPDGRKEYVIG